MPPCFWSRNHRAETYIDDEDETDEETAAAPGNALSTGGGVGLLSAIHDEHPTSTAVKTQAEISPAKILRIFKALLKWPDITGMPGPFGLVT